MPDPIELAQNPGDGKGAAPKMSDDARNALFTQFQLSQQVKKAERANPNVIDLVGETGYSLIHSGIQSPLTSVGQIADNLLSKADIKSDVAGYLTRLPAPEPDEFGTARWHAQQIGGAGGMVLPFMLTKGALNKAGLSFAARTEASALASARLMSGANAGLIADGAMAGFAYDFLMRPVEAHDADKFWEARTKHGLTGAATFGTLTAGSVALRHVSRPLAASLAEASKPTRIAYDFTVSALPGFPAGVVNADVNARLTQGRWATAEERKQGAYTLGMVGGFLGVAHGIPGSKVPLGDIARAYSSQRAARSNLEGMLVERARAATAPVEAAGESKLTGTARDGKSSSNAVVKEGRGLASFDVEGKVAEPMRTEVMVPKELQPLVQKGADLAFRASDPNSTPQQVVDFFNFARGEGKPLKAVMEQVGKAYAEDPRMMTLIREAYLPPEGVQHRVVEGDVKLKTPGATVEQYQRWGQFMQIVREMPQDVNGYVNFRHDVFRWLNQNRDLHDWARQYGEQNRYSKIAGPLDFYFGTSNLSRFVEVAERQALSGTEGPGSQTRAIVDQPQIRLDLTAEQARQGSATNRGAEDLAGALNIKNLLGGREVEGARTTPLETPPEPALGRQKSTGERMEAFEKPGTPHRKRIEAMQLSEHFGEMTTEQFAKWLDYAYAKPEGATSESASNLRSMWINNRDALLQPEVTDAYMKYRGFGETKADAVPLETVRQFLSRPQPLKAEPLPDWLNFYVEARMDQAQQTAKPEAKPHEVLDAALPRWLVDGLRAQHTTEARIAGEPPTYAETLPPQLAQVLEAARQSQPPKQPREGRPGRPEREFKPPTNDAAFRLARLNEILQIGDPVIRENLLRLGIQDHTQLRSITQKLDPERAAPEYKDLLRMVLPEAKNIGEVKILLDAIFFGNKNHRADRDSELTRSNQQLAMAAAERLVPQSNPNFEKTQQLVDDFITGKIRDPRPPRFGEAPVGDGRGGRDGGRFGRDGGRGDAKDADTKLAGQRPQGSATSRLTAPPRPPQEIVVKEQPPAVEVDPAANRGREAEVRTESEVRNQSEVRPEGEVRNQGEVRTEGPLRNDVAEQRVDTGTRTEGDTTIRPVVEQAPATRDLSALRNGQKVTVGEKDAIFVARDAHTGDILVRSGKGSQTQELFYNQKQFGKLKWHEVGRDTSTNRTLYRSNQGNIYEVRPHGSGFMTAERPEYRAVKPEEIK